MPVNKGVRTTFGGSMEKTRSSFRIILETQLLEGAHTDSSHQALHFSTSFTISALDIYFWIVVNGLRRQIVKWSLENQGLIKSQPGFQQLPVIPVTPAHVVRPPQNSLMAPPSQVQPEQPPVKYSEGAERY